MTQTSKAKAVTVVMSTYNGAERLRETLDSMCHIKAPEGGWKLIVVDNASTDNSKEIISSFSGVLPMVALYCAKQGKNAALNMAIPYFEGDLIIFADDDILVPENWLLKFQELASLHKEYSVFGSRIVPRWPSPPGEHILQGVSLGEAFAIHESDIPDGPVKSGKIWGPSMAVRAEIFNTGLRFDENIGPSKGSYIPGSESSFNRMLELQGHKFYFSNSLEVQHQIRPEQLTIKWLKQRAFKFGKARVFWNDFEGGTPGEKKIWIFPRWYFSYMLKAAGEYIFSLLSANKIRRMRATWNGMIGYGMITQSRAMYKEKSRKIDE